jgi:hypothetical protein
MSRLDVVTKIMLFIHKQFSSCLHPYKVHLAKKTTQQSNYTLTLPSNLHRCMLDCYFFSMLCNMCFAMCLCTIIQHQILERQNFISRQFAYCSLESFALHVLSNHLLLFFFLNLVEVVKLMFTLILCVHNFLKKIMALLLCSYYIIYMTDSSKIQPFPCFFLPKIYYFMQPLSSFILSLKQSLF